MHLEDLRGILLSERDSGTLVPIPHDLYQTTATLIRTMQQEVLVMDDPFSEEAQFLIEKIASIRSTAEELFQIRSEKIVSLAQSQASGSSIDRDAIRILIPAELDMFNRIVDGIRTCRFALIEWRVGVSRNQQHKRVDIPDLEPSGYAVPLAPAQPVQEREFPRDDGQGSPADIGDPGFTPEADRAYQPEGDWILSDDDEEDPFAYSLVRVLAEMEPFMGVDSRIYELAPGDIITIPTRNAEVLVERNIVLNINPG